MPGTSVAGHSAELTPEIRNTVKKYMDQTFENILRKVGQTVRFQCGHPITDMVLSELVGSVLAWTFNNEPLIMDPSRMFFYKGNLDVADLTPADTGVYECIVKWGPESIFENISVGVYSLQVTSETPTRYVFESDPMTLVCHSRALGRLFPASARRWLLNETAVTSLPATLAENKADELVPRVERKQAGVWECQVTHSRTNRTWGTAWLQIGVDDPPSFAARWYRAMVDHKALVFTIIGLVIIISFVVFLYSAFRLKKTEDETEKEFTKERKGWQETLNNFVEKGEVTAADFPDPETDDESSLEDEEEDTSDADDGGETSESDGGMEEETDEETSENLAAGDEAETPDRSPDDLADDSEDGAPLQSEANELDQIRTAEVDQSESDGADPNETDQNDEVETAEVDQGESDDAVLTDADAADQMMTAEVDRRGSDDAVPDGADRSDPVVMGEADRSEADDEAQNADQTNTNAWIDGVGSSPRADVRRSLIENVNECRTKASPHEKRCVRQRADVGSARRKPPKEKAHVALNKATAFEWLFKHSPHLKKLDSIMKEVPDVSLIDLDYSPPRHRGLVAPPGSAKSSKSDHNTVAGNRARPKMCHDRKIPKGSHGHELQKNSSKVENKTRGMIPGRSSSPECSKVVSDWRRRLEDAAKSGQVRPGSPSRRPAPWLPRFVERWRHSARRDDRTGRRVKYTALTQDDYV